MEADGRTSTDHQTDADAIIDAAQDALQKPEPIDPTKVYGGPYGLTFSDPERFGEEPRDKRGTVTLHTADSLIRYVNAQKTAGTALYADVKARKVVAILNDHVSGTVGDEPAVVSDVSGVPGWRDHRAALVLRSTPEWDRWIEHDKMIGEQVKFAEHIEDGAGEIVDEPTAAQMLELAQSIQATEKVQFESADRLTDGQRVLKYDQSITTTAGLNGKIPVPETFTVAIAPFEGGARYKVTARLRLRLSNGHLTIGYILEGVEEVQRAAFDELLSGNVEADTVGASIEGRTGLTAFRGTAPDSLR